MVQGPQPQVVSDPTTDSYKEDCQPAFSTEVWHSSEETFPCSQYHEEAKGGEHRKGAHTQSGISTEVGPVQDATYCCAGSASKDRQLAYPLGGCTCVLNRMLAKSQSHAQNRQGDAKALLERQSLIAECGGE